MGNSSSRQETGTQQQGGFLASLQILDNILPFMRDLVIGLAGFIKMTDEQREDAGIHLGPPWR